LTPSSSFPGADGGLSAEMDRMASGDMDGASRLLQEQKTSLEMKVRALESALRKAEVEKRIMEDNLRVCPFAPYSGRVLRTY